MAATVMVVVLLTLMVAGVGAAVFLIHNYNINFNARLSEIKSSDTNKGLQFDHLKDTVKSLLDSQKERVSDVDFQNHLEHEKLSTSISDVVNTQRAAWKDAGKEFKTETMRVGSGWSLAPGKDGKSLDFVSSASRKTPVSLRSDAAQFSVPLTMQSAGTISLAEIDNDTSNFKKLLISGNSSLDGVRRRVGIRDDLQVYGNMQSEAILAGGTDFKLFQGKTSSIFPINNSNAAYIFNDTTDQKILGIIGNKSDDGETARVGISDDLVVSGNTVFGGNIINLGDSILASSVLVASTCHDQPGAQAAQICNDTTDLKQTLVMGNRAADGKARNVGVKDNLRVFGDLTVDGTCKPGANFFLYQGNGGRGGASDNASEIYNDVAQAKKLMITGNSSDGSKVRKVGIKDDLQVYGNLWADGKVRAQGGLCVNDTCIDEQTLKRLLLLQPGSAPPQPAPAAPPSAS